MPWYTWDGKYDTEVSTRLDVQEYNDPDKVVVKGRVSAQNSRGEWSSTWWGKQWISVLESFGDTRLARGRTYARNGSVRDLTIRKGLASAKVQGSRRQLYDTEIVLRTLTEAEWRVVIQALAEQSLHAAKLLAGEMPADIEDLCQSVGVSLFPQKRRDITFKCSCPDWGDPCKHAAAVYYLVAEQLDRDPFLLFHLRGYARRLVLDALRRARDARANGDEAGKTAGREEPLSSDVEGFWSGAAHGLIHSPGLIPEQPPVLAMLGDPPGLSGDNLRWIYRRVSERALEWVNRETETRANGSDDNGFSDQEVE